MPPKTARRPEPVRRRRASEEESEEEGGSMERWLVTYADMVTLLMVLFIVLFAMRLTVPESCPNEAGRKTKRAFTKK